MGFYQSIVKSITKFIITAVITAAVLFILFGIQLPYEFIAPGRLITASKIVRVENGKLHKGKILIPTVIYERTTLFFYLYHIYDRRSSIIPFRSHTDETLHASSAESYDSNSISLLTEESVYLAKILALKKLGYDIPVNYEGLLVSANLDEKISPLQPGDLILYVDGRKIRQPDQLFQYLQTAAARKNSFRFTFIRGGMELSTVIQPARDESGRIYTGILFQPVLKREKLPVKIEVDTSQFEGPSAGLPVFIEIMNQLSETDLTGGKKITATGALDISGNILPIEGAGYKLMGAEKMECDYFICPEDNLMDAVKFMTYIKVEPVKDIEEVMEVLEAIRDQ
jgi:Lon-like protease